MGTPFQHALVDHPGTQWKLGQDAGISEVRMSKLARGRVTPRPEEIAKLAALMKRDPQDLFPSHDPVPA